MGISIPKIITIDEFKGSEIYDIALGDDTVAYSDNFILEAISMATMNMDQLSGFQLMKNIDTLEQSDLDYVKFGACKYVNHLLRKGPEYLRGSGASTLGGANFSQTNPDDPYYIPPEVWTALQKVNMLADFVVGNFKTPATATSGFSYTTRGDKFFEDGNFAVTVREGNAWYVRYDRVQSSDNTVKISLGNDVDRKVLNITLNSDGIIGVLENNTSFKNIVLSATLKNLDSIVDAVFTNIIKQDDLMNKITNNVETIIFDDTQFKNIFENAIKSLLEADSSFKNSIKTLLKMDGEFISDIGSIMASDNDIINAIASNSVLMNSVIENVSAQMTTLLKETFIDSAKNTVIDTLDNKSIVDAINSKKGDTLCTWTGNLNQLSQAADMILFLENNQSKIIDIRMNTTLAFDKLFGSGDRGRVAKEEVMMGWKIRMNDNFINIICECEENFKIGDKFSKTDIRFYFTIDRGNNWCGLLVANGGNVKIVEINDGVYLPNDDLTGYKGFEASDNGQGTFNILSNADDATLNEHFLITFKYFNDTEFEVPPYEPPTPPKVKRERFLSISSIDEPFGWQIQDKLVSSPLIDESLNPFSNVDLSTFKNNDGTKYEYDTIETDDTNTLPLDSKEYGLGFKVIGFDNKGTISSLGIPNYSFQGSEDIPESWFRPFYNFSDDVDNKNNWLDNFSTATNDHDSPFLNTLTYGLPDGEYAILGNGDFKNGVNDYIENADDIDFAFCFPYIYWYEEETQTNKQTKEIKIDPYKNDTYEEYVVKKEKNVSREKI